MTGVSRITQASTNAISALKTGIDTKDSWLIQRNYVYTLYKVAGEMRGTYKSNKRARETIAAQHLCSWEIVEVMDKVADEWTDSLARRALPYIIGSLINIYTGNSAEEINTTVSAMITKVNTMLTVKQIELNDRMLIIAQELSRVISPEALIATHDPEDKMD